MTAERPFAGAGPLRADARRNHGQLVAAARAVFIERGPAAPLEDVVARAGVGIGTLYRRFANRQALMQAVVLDALGESRETAARAIAETPTGIAALRRYTHALIDLRTSAMVTALLADLPADDAASRHAEAEAAVLMQRMVERAHADGALRSDVTAEDIMLILVRLSLPLPGGAEDRWAHRHLDLFLDGVTTAPTDWSPPRPRQWV